MKELFDRNHIMGLVAPKGATPYVNQWDQLFACLKTHQFNEMCEMKGITTDLRDRPKAHEIVRTPAGNRYTCK